MGNSRRDWEIVYLLYRHEKNEDPFSLMDLRGYWEDKCYGTPEKILKLGLDLIIVMDENKDTSHVHNLLDKTMNAINK